MIAVLKSALLTIFIVYAPFTGLALVASYDRQLALAIFWALSLTIAGVLFMHLCDYFGE